MDLNLWPLTAKVNMMYFLTELEGRAAKIIKRTELRSLFVVIRYFSTEITNFQKKHVNQIVLLSYGIICFALYMPIGLKTIFNPLNQNSD